MENIEVGLVTIDIILFSISLYLTTINTTIKTK